MPFFAACRLAHSWPLMHSLALYGKLDEERAEVVVEAVEVEVVDQSGRLHQPGI